MRFKEFVTEVFQPGKKNWEWSRLGTNEVSAYFKVGKRDYIWQAFTSRGNPKKWEIQFRLMRDYENDPAELDLYGTTGTGNSAEVMSTAVDITRAFLKDYGLDRIEEITFNAKEDSRIGLYAKMIKRLLPDWDLHSKKDPYDGMVFTLTDRRAYDKPENKLSEEAKAIKLKGLTLKFAFNDSALIMKAFDPATKNPLAFVKFHKEDKELYPQDLWVNDEYRNKGIAKTMYDSLKSEGFVINRSHDQTKAGAGFWDKHRGEDAYVWEQELDEVGDSYYDVSHAYDRNSNLYNRKVQYKNDMDDVVKRSGFEFTTQDGTKYWINIRKVKGGKTGRMGIDVAFHTQDNEFPWDINGKGNALKVFSTVKNVIAKYISLDPSISMIVFVAKNTEPSRVRLYKTFASQFTKYFPEFSETKVENHGDSTVFKLSKPLSVKEETLDEMPLPADWDPASMRQQATTFKSRLAYALERAKKLGTGSSRVATVIEYEGRPTVLKIAKNQKGLAQNSVEADILSDGYASQLDILIPIIDYDEQNREPSWVHTEMATKANEKQLCHLMKCQSLIELVRFANNIAGKYRGQTAQGFIDNLINDGRLERDIEVMTEYANKLADLANSFDVELADFGRAANWGIYNGKPVVVDVGFNSNVLNQYYR